MNEEQTFTCHLCSESKTFKTAALLENHTVKVHASHIRQLTPEEVKRAVKQYYLTHFDYPVPDKEFTDMDNRAKARAAHIRTKTAAARAAKKPATQQQSSSTSSPNTQSPASNTSGPSEASQEVSVTTRSNKRGNTLPPNQPSKRARVTRFTTSVASSSTGPTTRSKGKAKDTTTANRAPVIVETDSDVESSGDDFQTPMMRPKHKVKGSANTTTPSTLAKRFKKATVIVETDSDIESSGDDFQPAL